MVKKLKSSVIEYDWYTYLPRKEYSQWKKVETGDSWFEVYQLPKDVYAIYEPGHFQEVISFLICGSESCLLFDTGMGIGNIANLIRKLTELEVTVINSHFHFDHVGGNFRFSKIFVFDDASAVIRLRKGFSAEELQPHLAKELVRKSFPGGFVADEYLIPPVEPALLHDGDLLNLGNRTLQVVHTPGHTPDSIMLWDRHNRCLFTGDTFYPAALYTHFADEIYGFSDFETYQKTMDELVKLIPHLDYLFCSHNVPLIQPDYLSRAARAFHLIKEKKVAYSIDNEGLRRYDFDGFAIITANRIEQKNK